MNEAKPLQKAKRQDCRVKIQTGGISGSENRAERIQNIHSTLAELPWSLAGTLQML
jgi:hypothetical protein